VNLWRKLLLLLGLAALGPGLHAQTLISSITDPALFGSTLIDFESVAPNSAYNTLLVSTVTFGSNVNSGLSVDSVYAGQYNTQGQSLDNGATYSGNPNFTVTIDFSLPVTAFGFNFGASDAPWTLNAFDGAGTLLATRTISPVFNSNNQDFFGLGVGSGPAISHVTLALGGTSDDYIFIDNFRFVPIPEPGTAALLATGVLGLACWRFRRRFSRG
jgi:hypothetical protein